MNLTTIFNEIENIIDNFITKETDDQAIFERDLSLVLNSISLDHTKYPDNNYELMVKQAQKNFSATVVKNDKEAFFGVRVFPAIQDDGDLDAFVNSLIVQKKSLSDLELLWGEITNWNIELDSKSFDHSQILLNAREITALLLYELINVAYTSAVPDLIYNSYKNTYSLQLYKTQKGMEVLAMLYEIPLIQACLLKSWVVDDNGIVGGFPSGPDGSLMSLYYDDVGLAIGKIIKVYGNTNMLNSKDKRHVIDQLIVWASRYANDYTNRRNNLKDDLLTRALSTSSVNLRTLYIKILQSIGVVLRERYSGFLYASESFTEIMDRENVAQSISFEFGHEHAAMELCFNMINHKDSKKAIEALRSKTPKLPSSYEIDMIEVDADRMSNHYDRKSVLDEIYILIEKITNFLEYYADDKNIMVIYEDKANAMLKRLDVIRVSILETKNFAKSYKVFVNVPDKYMG